MFADQNPSSEDISTSFPGPHFWCQVLALILTASLWAAPSYAGDENLCYAVADGGGGGGGSTTEDILFSMDKTTGISTQIGTGTGVSDIEGVAFNPDTDELFATDGGQLGTIDLVTGDFTPAPEAAGTCRLSPGGTVETIVDLDGLTFDPFTGTLWASERRGSGSDLLLQLDPDTGEVVTDTFGVGFDCIAVTPAGGSTLFGDLDDLAIDPLDGTMFAIDNDSGATDQLVTIDTTTGLATPVSTDLTVDDMEGLSFGNLVAGIRLLYGTTGDNGVPADNNSLWTIDIGTGTANSPAIGSFIGGSDFEGVGCLTSDANRISGTVFYDVDGSGTLQIGTGDTGTPGITVRLYLDNNGDGLVDGGDTLLQSVDTDANGEYEFTLAIDGDFVLDIDTADLPASSTLTTDNIEIANFTGFGNVDTGNDFGFRTTNELDVVKTSDVVGDAVGGQTITYTVTVTNNSPIIHTKIEVLDPLPDDTSYVAESTVVSAPVVADAIRVTEYYLSSTSTLCSGSSFSGTSCTLTLGQNLEANYFVIVEGSAGNGATNGTRGPDDNYAAITGDPFGNLTTTSAANQIDLTRGATSDSWVGTVKVVECLADCAGNGFQLIDAQVISHTGTATSGTATSTPAWTDLDQVMLLGGFNGPGCNTAETGNANTKVCHVRFFPSGLSTINWTRDGGGATLSAATSTLMVVEWGSNWSVQRVRVTGNGGGDGVDATSEYNTAAITEVRRAQTWVWGTGHTNDNGIGDGAEGVLVTLGDGVTQNATENRVAAGIEIASNFIDFEVYALTHPDIAVDYRYEGFGNGTALTVSTPVDSATGDRMALVTNSSVTTSSNYPRPMLSSRYSADTTVTLERRRNGADNADAGFAAWIQGIDFSSIASSSPPLIATTLDNVPAGVNVDLDDGTPADLVTRDDNIGLNIGQSMTITYQVTLANPLDPDTQQVLNIVTIDSEESTTPSSDSVNDPVSRGGTIGDRVWLDVDGDGVQDIGEPGIANVEVTLLDVGGDGMIGGGDDTIVATTTTGTDGTYLFEHLGPGTYYVDVTNATVPTGLSTSPGTTDPSSTRTVTAEEVFLDVDFGYTNAAGTAIVGDTVWSDADGDGLLDPGEVGIEGVTVELLSAGPDGVLGTGDDIVEDTTTTGPDGSYLFTGVAAGEYLVEVDETSAALTGYTFSSGPQSVSNPSVPLTVNAGDTYLEADFGYTNAGTFSLADRVWLDADGDGTQDVGEPGIEGVVVNLLDASGDVIATTTTDSNGDFSFTGLTNGDYTMVIADTAGVLRRLSGTTTDARARSRLETIAGANVSGINFGFNGPGQIGDRVWSDADGDNVQDPGEPGLGGVTVQLWRDADSDGAFDNTVDTLVDTQVTAADGSYLFENLEFGTYFVSIDNSQAPLSGFTSTTPDEEVGGNAPGSQQDSVIANLFQSNLDEDFGYQDLALPDVSGTVFEDTDEDGLEDIGETGFADVSLALVDSNGVVIATTTTDSNGDYQFTGVQAGSYTVEVTDDRRILEGYRLTSGLDAIPITVAGSDITDIDFGYIRDPQTAAIGDRVWLDGDLDGIQDGAENGIADVTVNLTGPGCAPCTTTTDINGNYLFTGLAPGDYIASVDTSTLPGAGANLIATTANPTATINLSDGELYLDADFGFGSAPGVGAIGDRVWSDGPETTSNGLQDPGEPGLGGVEVILNGPGCSPCTATTTDDGSYLVTGLAPGTYTVTYNAATVPAGYNTTARNAQDYTIVLAAGEIIPTADFGFDAPAGVLGTIGDTVFLDADGDGTQDAGEPGIEGVTLNLLDASGDVIGTTTTDASGNYAFTGLPAGTYQVDVSDVAGVLRGLNLSAGTDPSASIVLAAGATDLTADFGYQPAGGSIGNLVWRDLDGDGVRDAGEAGMANVTVELWHDVNGNGTLDLGTDNLLRRTATDLAGEYDFQGLVVDQDYLVRVTDIFGVTAGFTLTSGAAGVDDNSQANPYAVSLTSAAPDDVTADFGYSVASGALTIAGTTFFDVDADGFQDAGPDFGVRQVTVLLFRDLDGDGVLDQGEPLIDSQLSDTNGDYLFTNLPPGDYIVASDATGTFLDGSDQTTQLLTNAVEPVTLVATNVVDRDFGFTRNATWVLLSGFSAYEQDGQVIVEWQTAIEAGTIGFSLYRWQPQLGEYTRVHDDLLPAAWQAPQGAVYRFADSTAAVNERQTYVLVEEQSRGREAIYGPYEVEIGSRRGTDKVAMEGSFHAEPRQADLQTRQRLAAHHDLTVREATKMTSAARLKLKVRDSGLYFVSVIDIANGLGRTVDRISQALANNQLRLTWRGKRVHWLAAPDSSGLFFYGEALSSLYTLDNVYQLKLGNGRPMRTRSATAKAVPGLAFSHTQPYEEDVFPATFVASDPEGDYWHWQGILAAHPSLGSHSFSLDVADPTASGDARLTVHLRGASDANVSDEHHAVIEWNGVEIGETSWSGLNDHLATFELDAAMVQDGDNTVTIRGLLDEGVPQSFFYVDAFDLTYERWYSAEDDHLEAHADDHPTITVGGFTASDILVLDVHTPLRPIVLDDATITADPDATFAVSFASVKRNRRFLAVSLAQAKTPELVVDHPSSLTSTSNRADYVIVTTAALRAAAEGLADHRRASGLEVEVVTIEDVMDELNHGIFDPRVLRDFLALAWSSWDLPPSQVLLAGAGHLDYRDLLASGGNLLPPLLTATPYGIYASDQLFVDVAGDATPEMAIGRLPVLLPSEIDTYLSKLEGYETAASGEWTGQALLIADNSDVGGNFAADSQAVQGLLPGFDSEPAYLGPLSTAGARQVIQEALSAGVGFVNYLGHGAVDRLAEEGLLTVADIAGLDNGDHLPLVASLTCNVARFELPGFTSLAASLVLAENGGAIAVWAPAGLSLNFEARALNEGFVSEVFQAEPPTLGEAIRTVLADYAQNGRYEFMLRIYNLIGEPALTVHQP